MEKSSATYPMEKWPETYPEPVDHRKQVSKAPRITMLVSVGTKSAFVAQVPHTVTAQEAALIDLGYTRLTNASELSIWILQQQDKQGI